MAEKQIYYYSCIFLVGIYTILNYSNFDESLEENKDKSWYSLEYPSEGLGSKIGWYLKTGVLFGLYMLLSHHMYKNYSDSSISNVYLGFIILLSLWFFVVSSYLFNIQPERKDKIWTQFSIMPNQNNVGVSYGYKILYLIGLAILSYKTISLKDDNQVLTSIFIIISYLFIGVLFQIFGSSLLFLFKKDDDKISWPSMMNYLDKYTDNSDFKDNDDSVISSQKVFNMFGYIRIIIIVLISGYISNSILNKENKSITDTDNFTIISIILLTSIILIISLILSQMFITDGCVITRTIKDDKKNDISSDNIMDPIYISIQNQGGFYLHLIILIIIVAFKNTFTYSNV